MRKIYKVDIEDKNDPYGEIVGETKCVIASTKAEARRKAKAFCKKFLAPCAVPCNIRLETYGRDSWIIL